METHFMLMGWKNKDCENVFTTKAIHTFKAIPIKIPTAVFTELEQAIRKFVWNHKRSPIAKAMLKKKTKRGISIIPVLKIHFKGAVINIIWYCHKIRHTDEWNSIENPEIDSYLY